MKLSYNMSNHKYIENDDIIMETETELWLYLDESRTNLFKSKRKHYRNVERYQSFPRTIIKPIVERTVETESMMNKTESDDDECVSEVDDRYYGFSDDYSNDFDDADKKILIIFDKEEQKFTLRDFSFEVLSKNSLHRFNNNSRGLFNEKNINRSPFIKEFVQLLRRTFLDVDPMVLKFIDLKWMVNENIDLFRHVFSIEELNVIFEMCNVEVPNCFNYYGLKDMDCYNLGNRYQKSEIIEILRVAKVVYIEAGSYVNLKTVYSNPNQEPLDFKTNPTIPRIIVEHDIGENSRIRLVQQLNDFLNYPIEKIEYDFTPQIYY